MIRLSTAAAPIDKFVANFSYPVGSVNGSSSLVTINHNLGKKASLIHIERVSDNYRVYNMYRANSQAAPAGARRAGWIPSSITANSVTVRLYRFESVVMPARMIIYFFDEETQ